jgi:hypothetical protein
MESANSTFVSGKPAIAKTDPSEKYVLAFSSRIERRKSAQRLIVTFAYWQNLDWRYIKTMTEQTINAEFPFEAVFPKWTTTRD